MKLTPLNCPNCGGKLRKKNLTTLQCESCGTEFYIEEEQPEINQTINHNYYSNSKVNSAPVRKKSMLIIFCCLTLIPILFLFFTFRNERPRSHENQSNKIPVRTHIQSDAMKDFLYQAYGKETDSISKEELATLTYLNIATVEKNNIIDDFWEFTYSKEPYSINSLSSTQTIYVPITKKLEQLDFTLLTGLEYLNYNNFSDIESTTESYSLKGLDNLVYYGGDFNRSFNLTTDEIAHKDKIKGLKTELRTNDDIKLLLQYPNLESLSINYIGEEVSDFGDLYHLKKLTKLDIDTSPKDISWLTGITQLRHLSIQSGYELVNFSALHSLSQLETLSLHTADSLKDISFVKNMPNLTTLDLYHTAVMDLAPLTDRESIQSLSLIYNSSIHDYSVIGGLLSLNELEIDTSENSPNIPSLHSLNQLTSLSINSEFRDTIVGNKTIEDLTLIGDIEGDLFYSDFPAINKLTLRDASLYSASTWQTTQSITDLTLEDITTVGQRNNEQLFKLHNIQKITLLKTSLGIDVDKFESSNSLISLDISSDSSLGYDDINPYLNKISGCIHLENLSLPNQKIQNLEFVTPLTELKNLDLEDNYITNVTPLTSLSNLERVNLRNNPVANSDLLQNTIVIK